MKGSSPPGRYLCFLVHSFPQKQFPKQFPISQFVPKAVPETRTLKFQQATTDRPAQRWDHHFNGRRPSCLPARTRGAPVSCAGLCRPAPPPAALVIPATIRDFPCDDSGAFRFPPSPAPDRPRPRPRGRPQSDAWLTHGAVVSWVERLVTDLGYMSRKIRKFRTDQFDTRNKRKF